MKRILAIALSMLLLLGCVTAMAEAEEKDTLTMQGAFSIKYPKLPDYYSMNATENTDMEYRAIMIPKEGGKPILWLSMAFNDEWEGVNTLSDVSEEDMAAVKASFYEVTELDEGEISFEDAQTAAGIPMLIARAADGAFGAIYTIYQSHEVEVDIFPNGGAERVTEEDIDTVLQFLTDAEFVPVEA